MSYTQVADLLLNLDYYHSCIQEDPATGCHLWVKGGKHRQGYGMMSAFSVNNPEKKIMTTAHRIAYRLATGQAITSKQMVIHTCGNMNCCNPAHLILGDRTTLVNTMTANRVYEDRRTPKRKTTKQNRDYKYTNEEIHFIRTKSTAAIERRYDITNVQALALKKKMNRNYRWLK